MKTIEITQIAGTDKLLHVTIPVDEANRSYRVVIVIAPEGIHSGFQGGPLRMAARILRNRVRLH